MVQCRIEALCFSRACRTRGPQNWFGYLPVLAQLQCVLAGAVSPVPSQNPIKHCAPKGTFNSSTFCPISRSGRSSIEMSERMRNSHAEAIRSSFSMRTTFFSR